MVLIINYGIGNLRSIQHKLHKLGIEAKVSSKLEDIGKADKLILPGVGHFKKGMENLKQFNLIDLLKRKVLIEKTPILGICLGFQLFSEWSEEGDVEGLRFIQAKTMRFKTPDNNGSLTFRVPHVGWNSIKIEKQSRLLEGIDSNTRFYFTHSYHMAEVQEQMIAAKTWYGYDFASIIERDNIYGTQFHPEKSHKSGMNILKNFIERCV